MLDRQNTKKLMPVSNICLFFSDTGGGHRSATDAIEAGIYAIVKDVWGETNGSSRINVVTDNIIEKSHFINRMLVELYNFLLRYDQAGMKYYYSFIHHFKPNESQLCVQLLKPYTKKMLAANSPAVVVSLHPMINQSVAEALQEFEPARRPKFVIVVTDPNDSLWRGWACSGADLIIVPNEAARGRLLSWGVPLQKMQVIGMPVHPNFISPPLRRRQQFLSDLGLDPEVFTLCLNAGWAGGGNLTSIYQSLNQVKRKIQVIFLCGYHYKFYSKLNRWAAYSNIPTRVFAFHDNMPDLMSAVDLMVTKAGGLTTFEAIARKLPMAIDVITEPMPQEAGTIDILLQAKLAQVVKKPNDIVDIIENMPMSLEDKNFNLPEFQNLNRVDAVYDIARAILSYVDPSISSKEKVVKSEISKMA